MLIAEKWANRSSPPPSGVMNPNPLASLNHFTVPVGILLVTSHGNERVLGRRARSPCRAQGCRARRETELRHMPARSQTPVLYARAAPLVKERATHGAAP